ncbi:MAG: hypothetical protein RX318_03265 [bacterium]|nr:hypothetical protein [bacterium]
MSHFDLTIVFQISISTIKPTITTANKSGSLINVSIIMSAAITPATNAMKSNNFTNESSSTFYLLFASAWILRSLPTRSGRWGCPFLIVLMLTCITGFIIKDKKG